MKLTVLSNALRVLGAIAFTIFTSTALADSYKVTKIHDGDTISVVNTTNNQALKIRLACIDSPENSQKQGRLSTVTLNAFIPIGSSVELNIVDTDRYDRSVAEVFRNNVNVNLSMLKKGQAVVYHQYLSNCPDANSYLEAEKLAKDKEIGFWNDSSFITPMNWRRGVRPSSSQPESPAQPTTSRGYITGSCKYLKSLGLSRFTRRDPNYTNRRDRDNDGVACE